MPRRKRLLDEAASLTADLIDSYWPVGAVVSVMFSIFTAMAFYWVSHIEPKSSFLSPLFKQLLPIAYVLPLVLGVLTLMIIWKTVVAFLEQSHY